MTITEQSGVVLLVFHMTGVSVSQSNRGLLTRSLQQAREAVIRFLCSDDKEMKRQNDQLRFDELYVNSNHIPSN